MLWKLYGTFSNMAGVALESKGNVLLLFTESQDSGYLTNINICLNSSFSHEFSKEREIFSISGPS